MPSEYDLQRATVGTSGQLRADIGSRSDAAKQDAKIAATRASAMEANTAQNLKAATGGGGDIRALNAQIADKIVEGLSTPAEVRTEKMKKLGARIVDMEKRAKDIEKSGTGNTAAANTYMQVAAILRQRLADLQNEDVGIGPATQPSQQMVPVQKTAQPSSRVPLEFLQSRLRG